MEMLINTGVSLIATETIRGLVKISIETFIKPKLQKLYTNIESEDDLINIEYCIKDYLERSYKSVEIMNTIVFKNQQKKVDDLYIPLTLLKCNEMYKDETEEIYIDKYKDDLMKYKKILLVDSAGMGKSTIIKYLYLNVIRENKGIPVLIELRKLEKNSSIIEFILKEINGLKEYFNKENILDLIDGGDFIFFFDGYDEIVQEYKKDITHDLQSFISKTPKNTFIISSRDENELSCFGDFQRFDIKSLKKEEAYQLIKKYDNNRELSKVLINKLETEENLKIIKEFLENPLMVSLLYKTFDYKRTIPYKKHTFYRNVYNSLFEEHDLSKSGAYERKKESGLDIEDFHCVLRMIGFLTLKKGIIYSREEFVGFIKQAKEKIIGINFNENKFIKDVIHAVPIFLKEGNDYRWVHKSFQEYFAAMYISCDSKSNRSAILNKICEKDKIQKYYNVLDFYYDIDYKGFIREIIFPILKDLEKFFNETYTDDTYRSIDDKIIMIRKLIEFKYEKICIRKLSEEELLNLDKKGIDSFGTEIFKFFFKYDKNTMSNSTIINEEIGIDFKYNNLSYLLNLLYNKKSDIVMRYDIKSKLNSEDKFIDVLEEGTYIVNDNIENRLNYKNIFELSNDFIIRNECSKKNINGLLFNYENCMKLKNKIEKEIEYEYNDLNFL